MHHTPYLASMPLSLFQNLKNITDAELNGIASALLTLIISFIVFYLVYKIIKKILLKMVKNKRQVSNVMMFLNIMKYIFLFFLLLIFISSYFGSWMELGLTAGLLSAALGWALQKPIVGMAAWIMIAMKRPFTIGDRVSIKGIVGDIADISLNHIYLAEVGGTIDGEEQSGRIVMIPNSLLFEIEIINYTKTDEYVLDEVTVGFTYESNLAKAERIMTESVRKVMSPVHESFPKKISREFHLRVSLRDSSVGVTIRYYVPARGRNELSSAVIRDVLVRVGRTGGVSVAYPHMQLVKEK